MKGCVQMENEMNQIDETIIVEEPQQYLEQKGNIPKPEVMT